MPEGEVTSRVQVVVTIDVEFGDRPSSDPLANLEKLLRILDHHGAPATFFVQGRWAKAHPSAVAELAGRGGAMGLHGYSHVDYRRLSLQGVRAELADGVAAIEAGSPGADVPFVRLPHGFGTDDPSIKESLGDAGLTPVGWDFSTFDWDDSLALERRVERALGALELGGVVLMHSWPDHTADILAAILEGAGEGVVVPLASVELKGEQSSGRTIHPERVDPPR